MRDYVPAGLLVLLMGVALYFLIPAYTRYRDTKLNVDHLRQSVARQEEDIRRLRDELAALRTDHRAIERVAREKFGWCREDEKIYHFSEPLRPMPGGTTP